MKRFLKIGSNGIIPLLTLAGIFASYVYLTSAGYKLFNQANTNKYNPQKSQHYHK